MNCFHKEKKENQNAVLQKQEVVGLSDSLSSVPIKLLPDTCGNYDKILIRLAGKFIPTSMYLDKSISPELRSFITSIDTSCLRKQKQYKFFVSEILAKLYVYHVKKIEVGANLLSMKTGAAKTIINALQLLTGHQHVREFYNSGMVVDFIRKDSLLKKDKKLYALIKDID